MAGDGDFHQTHGGQWECMTMQTFPGAPQTQTHCRNACRTDRNTISDASVGSMKRHHNACAKIADQSTKADWRASATRNAASPMFLTPTVPTSRLIPQTVGSMMVASCVIYSSFPHSSAHRDTLQTRVHILTPFVARRRPCRRRFCRVTACLRAETVPLLPLREPPAAAPAAGGWGCAARAARLARAARVPGASV